MWRIAGKTRRQGCRLLDERSRLEEPGSSIRNPSVPSFDRQLESVTGHDGHRRQDRGRCSDEPIAQRTTNAEHSAPSVRIPDDGMAEHAQDHAPLPCLDRLVMEQPVVPFTYTRGVGNFRRMSSSENLRVFVLSMSASSRWLIPIWSPIGTKQVARRW